MEEEDKRRICYDSLDIELCTIVGLAGLAMVEGFNHPRIAGVQVHRISATKRI